MADEKNTSSLSIEEAIKTALEYETKVRDVYLEAVEMFKGDIGTRVFGIMAKEEQGHIDYLESRLKEWQTTGSITPEKIETVVPNREQIEVGVKALKNRLQVQNHETELKMLQKALEVEEETSEYYRKLVNTMEAENQKMFKRFLEIEEGHLAVVQAEIDSVSGMGFYFDMAEFNLEAG